MPTRNSRRLYPRRRETRSRRSYSYPRRGYRSYRSGGSVRGYGSYFSAIAPYAIRAAPYIRRGYQAYRKGGIAGAKYYAGSLASRAAKSAIKAVTGYGAYRSVGRGGMQGKQVPKIRNGGQSDGSVIISNEEYLGDVITSLTQGKFLNHTYLLNPGSEKAFPWLSHIAKNFQEYRWEGLCFSFKSMSGNAITDANTALGTVIMATNYDPTQANPSSKAEMENMEFANSCKPSASMQHYIECAKSQSPLTNLYINPNPLTQTGDPRFYDFGKFNIATQGMQGTKVNIGELWVSYQIRLFKPQLWDAMGKDVDYFNYLTTGTKSSISNTHPLGTLDISRPELNPDLFYVGNTIKPIAFDPASGGVVFAPVSVPKCYCITMWWYNNNGMTHSFGTLLPIGCTLNTQPMSNATVGTNQYWENPQPSSNNDLRYTIHFYLRTDGNNLNEPWGWKWTTLPAVSNSTSFFNLIVTEMPHALPASTLVIT